MSDYSPLLDALDNELRKTPPVPGSQPSPKQTSAPGASPFPGLRPFMPEETHFFRGRSRQIWEIGQRLATENCVAVLGGSGCGKSSIVRAGVIPALRRKLIPGRGDLWRTAIFTPGRAPMDNLVHALDSSLRPEESEKNSVSRRAMHIREVLYGPDHLGGFLPIFRKELDIDPGFSTQARNNANLFILVDQFEELFRGENKGKAQTARLVELIIDFWKRRSVYPGLYLALTMRTDDLHRCAEFIDLPDLINATAYLTRRLREDELREAIVAPVRPPMFRAGLLKGELDQGQIDLRPYDVQLVKELLDATAEISHDPDHLPLLQHLLAVLWRYAFIRWRKEADRGAMKTEPRIIRDDLAGILGCENWSALVDKRKSENGDQSNGWLLRQCLNHLAEELYEGKAFGTPLTTDQRDLTRTAFCLMGEIDDRGNFKRRWTTEEEIAQVAGLNGPGPDTAAFVHRFSKDHRLLWIRKSGVMDVSHEALMRNWHRLSDWLTKNRDEGKAYLRLARCYQQWERAGQAESRWLSWFKRIRGLLGSDTVKGMAPLLTRQPTLRLRQPSKLPGQLSLLLKVSPRNNRYWAQRYTSSDVIEKPNTADKQIGESEDAVMDTAYAKYFGYLRRSIWKNWVKRVGLLVVIILVLSLVIVNLNKNRIAADQKRILKATLLWGAFEGWRPVPTPAYVDGLWKVALEQTDVRTEFVRRIPEGNKLRQLGFSPQPIIRAVGLRWTFEQRDIISDFLKKELDKKKFNPHWTEASLATAVSVLDDRIGDHLHDLAQARFQRYVDEEQTDSGKSWTLGRILACVGQKLDNGKREKAIAEIIANAQQQTSDASGFALGQAASGVTTVAWLHHGRSELSPEEQGTVSTVIDTIIDRLKDRPAGFSAILTARTLVSLVATLPPKNQLHVLRQILSTASQWKDNPDPDLIIILARAFETAARQVPLAPDKDQLQSLIHYATELLNRNHADNSSNPINRIALARLAISLATVVDPPDTFVDTLDTLVGTKWDPAKTADDNGMSENPTEHDGLLIGMQGHRFAFRIINAPREPAATDPDQTIKRIGRLIGIVTNREDPLRSCYFAREGLAHALGALAGHALLEEKQKEAALKIARDALARTGSAEEAAAWAVAITNLLKDKAIVRFVESIVDLLKYPTAALTAREPNAREPRNATDIFLQALEERKELKTLLAAHNKGSGRRCRINILDTIVGDQRFKDIRLMTQPNDPRINRPQQ